MHTQGRLPMAPMSWCNSTVAPGYRYLHPATPCDTTTERMSLIIPSTCTLRRRMRHRGLSHPLAGHQVSRTWSAASPPGYGYLPHCVMARRLHYSQSPRTPRCPRTCHPPEPTMRKVTRRHVDILIARAYHSPAAKMTRRGYIFDGEYILTCCLG